MNKIFIALIFCFIAITSSYSQNLNIITQITQPFPTALGEIEENGDVYTTIITNTSGSSKSFYLFIDLIGDNGVVIYTDRDYKPSEALVLDANSSVTYTFEEIYDHYDGFNSDNLVYEGVTEFQINLLNTLPEGNYQICVSVFDFDTEEQIGVGCSITFPVGNENVPIIISPYENEIIPATDNFSFLISWETPVTNPSQLNDLEYELKIIDLTEAYDDDLEELFSDSGTSVVLETETTQSSYFYNGEGSDPDMIPGYEYGVRIRVLDIEGNLTFENNGYSEIRRFFYGENADGETEQDSTGFVGRELPDDCESRCNIAQLEDTTITTNISNFDTLMIGYFKMVDLDLSPVGNMFTGTAKVIIDFVNNIEINVEVSAIKINSQGQIIEGTVKALQDAAETVGDLAEYINFGKFDDQIGSVANNIPETEYDGYLNYLNEARSLSAALLGINSTGLPISFGDTIKGNHFTIALTDLILKPGSAIAKVIIGTKLAVFDGENSLLLVADSVCIHPAGFGGQYNLSLQEDLVFPFQADNRFNLILKGNTQGAVNYTKINFDCAGISSLDIAGEIHFPRNIIRPMDGDSILDEKAKAYFNYSLIKSNNNDEESSDSIVNQGNHINWIAEVTMDKFSINKLKGWTFEMTTGYWDMSDISNPEGIVFPEDYHTKTPDYRGFYLKEAIITPPKNLFSSNGDEVASTISSAMIHDLFIDPHLYGKLEAVNVLPLEKGRLDGWGFSIDTIYLEYYDSQLLQGKMDGYMQMPLLEETDSLKYTALMFDMNSISDDENESEGNEPEDLFYAFDISLRDTVHFPFLIANGTIYDDSYFDVGFYPSQSEQAFVRAVLHGELNIDSDLYLPAENAALPAALKLPGLEYKLDYTSGEDGGFNPDSSFVSFASPQKSIGGFLVSMENFDVGMSNEDSGVSVDFDVAVGIGKGNVSVQATSSFSIKSNLSMSNAPGSMQEAGSMLKSFKIEQVKFDSVSIGLDMEKFKMNGSVFWYNDEIENGGDGARNKGVRGDLDIELPLAGIGGKFAAGFGTYGKPPDLEEGVEIDYDSTFYSYWFVDGLLFFGPTGIPISPGIAIYGLGGGVSYNMVQTGSLSVLDSTIQGQSMYEPVYDAFNLKLAATLGTTPSPNAFNADIGITAQFVNGGLDLLSIDGDGYIATPLQERDDPKLWVDVGVEMHLPNEERTFSMDGHLNVAMNLDSTLYGNLPESTMDYQLVAGDFHASQDSWYFYLGEPDMDPGVGSDPRGSARLELGDILKADLKTYMMVGHGVPTEIPPLPTDIERILNDPSGELAGTTGADNINSDFGQVDYSTGMGFAHGSYAELKADIDAKIIYAHLNAYLGYDMNLTQNLTQYCSNTGELRGINGWYAQGQAYAGIEGDMGVRLKLFGKQRDINIMQLAAAIALTGGGPKPFYFGGRASIYYELLGGKIKGNSSFQFSVGERCSPMSGNPFAGLDIIEYVDPGNSEEEIFVGKNMSVKFALPMDTPLYVPTPVYDANNEIIDIRELSFTPKFSFQFTKNNDEIVFTQPIQWADDNNHEQFYVLPTEMLKQNKWYKLKVTVKAMDNQTNKWLIDENTNKVWQIDTLVRFKTGEFPESFEGFVSYAVPLAYERYYLQDISHAGRIYLTSGLDQNHYFPANIPNMKGSFEYFVRFTNLQNQESKEVPFTYVNYANSAPQLRFNIPQLDNEAIYALQVIRKGTANYKGTNVKAKPGKKEVALVSASKEDVSTEITLTNDQIAPGKQLANDEDLLYYTYFRTSKFNTLAEKLNASNVTGTSYVGTTNNKKLRVNLTLQESFEERDFRPFRPLNSNIGNMLFEPKIKIRDPFDKVFHNSKAKPRVAGFINNYNDNVKGGMIYRNIPENLRIDWGQYTNYWLPSNNFHSSLSEPLSESEIESLWNNYVENGVFGNTSFHSTTTMGGYTVNILQTISAYIIYDTHFNVQKDKIDLKNWVLNYYSSICFPQPCITYLNQHPSFDNKYTQMKNTDFKITSNTGNYNLSFYPNGSDKPGEYFPNFFKSVNINFSTPPAQLSSPGNKGTFQISNL